jgi:hypothetical protein
MQLSSPIRAFMLFLVVAVCAFFVIWLQEHYWRGAPQSTAKTETTQTTDKK